MAYAELHRCAAPAALRGAAGDAEALFGVDGLVRVAGVRGGRPRLGVDLLAAPRVGAHIDDDILRRGIHGAVGYRGGNW